MGIDEIIDAWRGRVISSSEAMGALEREGLIGEAMMHAIAASFPPDPVAALGSTENSDAELIAALRKRPYDRAAREAALRLEELAIRSVKR